MDSLIALWLFLLAAGSYLVVARRTGDVFHPLAVFLAGWLGVFAFAHLGVPRTYDEPYYALPFEVRTYAAVAFAGAAFVVGFLLLDPSLSALNRRVFWKRLRASVRVDRMAAVTLAMFAVASITTLYFVLRLGEIPLISPRIHELRRIFKVPLLGYLFDMHYAVALFAAALALWTRQRPVRWFWAGIVVLSTLELMTMGVRMSPMTALAWVFVLLALRPGQGSVRRIVTAVVISAVVFGVIEQYRRSLYRVDPTRLNPRLDLSAAATVWGHSAASFKNLQITLDRVSPLHMGIASYDLPKTFHPDSRDVDAQLAALYGTHNTPTFLGFLYFDFGWGGMLLIPGLYGAISALVYRRLRTDPRMLWLLIHLEFLLAGALAFRTHRFFSNQLIFFIGVGLVVEFLVGRRHTALDAPPASPGRPLPREAWVPG